MKKKFTKRLLSIFLSLGMLCGATETEGLFASAENDYDITLTITYPRPEEAPEAPSAYESAASPELTYLGCEWKTAGNTEQWNDGTEFVEWMHTFVSDTAPGILSTFTDGKMYQQRVYLKISNVSVPTQTAATATVVDAATMQQLDAGEVYWISCKELLDEFGEGTDLPSGMTINDSLIFIDTSAMICSPREHMHTESSECAFDDQNHWKVCSECGLKLTDTIRSHSGFYGKLEKWTCTQYANEKQEGIWQKTCSSCAYAYDTIKSPTVSEQTIVSSYKELQAALAKGGKQWITLKTESSKNTWIYQEDMTNDNMLVLDDPDADITIHLNGCSVIRNTGKYDDALFDIRQGKLRIFSTQLTGVPANDWNMQFQSAAYTSCLFHVGKNGTLRLTNISGATPYRGMAYGQPMVISEGDLQIDGGHYRNMIDTFIPSEETRGAAILIDGGTAVINGGRYEGTACGVAVRNAAQLTVNGGYIGSWDTGLYIGGSANAVINDGEFDRYEITSSSSKSQNCAVMMESSGDLTIHNGNFCGAKQGLFLKSAGQVTIWNGSFKSRNPREAQQAAMVISDMENMNVTVYNGTFSGTTGIRSNVKFSLKDILPDKNGNGMKAMDNGVVIDLNTEAFIFGENRLTIEKSVPIITKQPQNVTLISGNDARFSIEAIGAVRYEWEIFDVEDDTQQPYSRETVLAHCSGVNSFEESTFQIYGVSSWFMNKAVHVWIKGKDGSVTSHTAYFNIIVKPPAEVSQLKNVIVAPGGTTSFTFETLYADEFRWSFTNYEWDQIDNEELLEYKQNGRTLTLYNVSEFWDGETVYCDAMNELGYITSDKAVITVGVAGDVNEDGMLTVADLLMLQKWLIRSGPITNGRLGDLDGDGVLNGMDLLLLRKMLLVSG